MGGAISSNVASAITNVMNDIQNSASGNNAQIGQCILDFEARNCHISGGLNVKSVCNISATSNQVISLVSQNKLQSIIAQKLLQEATSEVGSAGIGFAGASNVTNALVNSANSIQNIATGISNQDASSTNIFKLQNCDIEGGVNIDVNSDLNFISTQAIANNSVNDLTSNVTQSVSQTASATVEGLAAFLIALAILIVAIGYVVFKPVGMILSNKFIMITVISLILLALVIAAFLLQWPPFFNPPTECNNASVCGTSECIDPTPQKVSIQAPPLRYTYNIIGTDATTPGTGQGQAAPGLLQMVIQKSGGWSLAGYNTLNTILTSYQNVPNPLKLGGVNNYITDWDTWNAYSTNNPLYARFVLCDILQIDTTVYIFPAEYCRKANGTVSTPDATCFQYIPTIMPTPSQTILALTGGGVVSGNFGVCNFPTYRLQSFMKPWGFIILGLVIVGIFTFIILYRSGEKEEAKPETKE
jgi:hypothetical protein